MKSFFKKYLTISLLSIILSICCYPIFNNLAHAQTIRLCNPVIEYYFTQSNHHPELALINLINSTKHNLDIAIYSLTDKDTVNAIVYAKNRKVNIRIITDKIQSANKYQKEQLNILKDLGIPIKVDSHTDLMHLKVTISDYKVVTTGSFNYTNNAKTYNDEVLLIIKDFKIARLWTDEFNNMWYNDKKVIDY